MAVSRFNPDYPDAGTVQIVPASVVVGGGSGSANGNGTISFSGVSSISLNNVFSSRYDNYLVQLDTTTVSTTNDIRFRYRVGGVDLTSGHYFCFTASLADGGNISQYANASTSYYDILAGCDPTNTYISSAIITVMKPFLTQGNSIHLSAFEGRGTFRMRVGSGAVGYANTTSYDGFTLLTSTGTMTGSLKVYGYRI